MNKTHFRLRHGFGHMVLVAMVLMPVVFTCNEAYKRLEILHCNVWPGGEWWLAHLAQLGRCCSRFIIIDLLLVVFPFDGFPC